MPILLILALGASVAFIAIRAAEAAQGPCSDEVIRNAILTAIAIFKTKTDGIERVSKEAASQTRIIAGRCRPQIKTFLDRNPTLEQELRKAKDAFDAKDILQRRDKAFLPK